MKKKRQAKMLIPREKRLPNRNITSSMKMYRNMMLFQRDRLNRGEQSAIGLVTSELNIEECLGEFDYHRLTDIVDFSGAISERPHVGESFVETTSHGSIGELINRIDHETESDSEITSNKLQSSELFVEQVNKQNPLDNEPMIVNVPVPETNFEPNSAVSANNKNVELQTSITKSDQSITKLENVKTLSSLNYVQKPKRRRSLRLITLRAAEPIIENTTITNRKRKLPSTETNVKVEKEEEDDNENENISNDKISQNKLVKVVNLHCPECSLVLNKRNFNQHLREMHGKLRFRCRAPDCNEQFDDRNLFHQHLKLHLSNTKWTCTTCWFEAPNSSTLSSHWNRFHRKGLFQCTHCRANFPYRSEVYNHFYREHSTKVYKYKPVKCGECGYIARDASCLKRHQITHTDLKPFECAWDGCDFACNRRCHAIRHVCSIHFGIPQSMKAKERKEKCDRNPIQFVRIVNLR